MSMDTCADCGRPVDTDDDPGAYIEVGNMRRLNVTICVCEPCRDLREQRQEAEDAAAGRCEAEAEARECR